MVRQRDTLRNRLHVCPHMYRAGAAFAAADEEVFIGDWFACAILTLAGIGAGVSIARMDHAYTERAKEVNEEIKKLKKMQRDSLLTANEPKTNEHRELEADLYVQCLAR